jgi:hypothetical protein
MLLGGLLALALARPAGAASPEVNSEFRLKPDARTGIVLFSTWMPEMTGAYTKYTLVKIFYRDITKSSLMPKTVLFYREMLFKPDVPSDFPQGYGLLRALELPPGDYEFMSWSVVANAGVTFYPKKPRPLPFRVEAGRATYVGGFDLDARRGDNVFGAEVVFQPWLWVTDRRDRDLEVLPKKFPGIPLDRVDVRPVDPTPWKPDEAASETMPTVVPAT